ncbi:hypothetical protein IWQ60_011339 [Tieghemiomyces parasiticus]|uniref:26S proteasome complex subunit SEM1 n=1 Tax=Tieghemiomyces parasiticus TaxID=78921 RepID=A0A9W7ZNH7_9FUNG|nr:hypothetical protein IWQ60_011339 [Tieghemiomyces parasiticus]
MSAPAQSNSAAPNGPTPASDQATSNPAPQLGLLEEDDEFEEFEVEDWDDTEEDQLDKNQWEDNWDDDDVEDDFAQQLR